MSRSTNASESPSSDASEVAGGKSRALLMLIPAALAGVLLGWLDATNGNEAQELGFSETPSERGMNEPGSEILARVGDVDILTVEVDAALREAGVEPGIADSLQRSQAVEELIDQELWLQAALDDDRARRHQGLRDAVVRRMLDAIFVQGEPPQDNDLQRLYEEAYADKDGDPPPLEKVRFRLQEEWLRQRNDQALSDYLIWLRQRTETTVYSNDEALEGALAEALNRSSPSGSES